MENETIAMIDFPIGHWKLCCWRPRISAGLLSKLRLHHRTPEIRIYRYAPWSPHIIHRITAELWAGFKGFMICRLKNCFSVATWQKLRTVYPTKVPYYCTLRVRSKYSYWARKYKRPMKRPSNGASAMTTFLFLEKRKRCICCIPGTLQTNKNA